MSNLVRINFMGDVNLGAMLEHYKRGVSGKIQKKSVNPFYYVANYLRDGDINVCNLECVLSDTSDKSIPFSEVMRAPVNLVNLLKENNIHVVNLANNHTMDHGLPAFNEMRVALNKVGINTILDNYRFPDEENMIIRINRFSIGFIGYYIEETISPEEYSILTAHIHKELALISERCDKIVLSLHWGYEYSSNPLSWQINLAKEFIKTYKKLSVIYGHHAHTLQGVHRYKNCVFVPSMGNFVFDDHLKKNRISGMLNISISDLKTDYKLEPCFINTNYQPVPTARYVAHVHQLNKALEEVFTRDDVKNTDWDNKMLAQSKRGHLVNRIKVRVLYFVNLFRYFNDLKLILIRKERGR